MSAHVELRVSFVAEGDRDEELARGVVAGDEAHRWVCALVDSRGLIEVLERGWERTAEAAVAAGLPRFIVYDKERR